MNSRICILQLDNVSHMRMVNHHGDQLTKCINVLKQHSCIHAFVEDIGKTMKGSFLAMHPCVLDFLKKAYRRVSKQKSGVE